MATHHKKVLIDDWDGVSEAHKTVHFSYEGKHYEMDLSVDNYNMVHNAFGEYIGKARLVSSGRGRGRGHRVTRTAAPSNKEHLNKVRTWARANGYEVKDRGRIPTHIEAAYAAKH